MSRNDDVSNHSKLQYESIHIVDSQLFPKVIVSHKCNLQKSNRLDLKCVYDRIHESGRL